MRQCFCLSGEFSECSVLRGLILHGETDTVWNCGVQAGDAEVALRGCLMRIGKKNPPFAPGRRKASLSDIFSKVHSICFSWKNDEMYNFLLTTRRRPEATTIAIIPIDDMLICMIMRTWKINASRRKIAERRAIVWIKPTRLWSKWFRLRRISENCIISWNFSVVLCPPIWRFSDSRRAG